MEPLPPEATPPQPTSADTNAAEVRLIEAKLAEAKLAEDKPPEVPPAEVPSAEVQLPESKPVGTKPLGPKPAAQKPPEAKPLWPKPPAPKAAEPKPADLERWKNLVVMLTVLTTVIATLIASLQADASLRANRSNRESQSYAIELTGELQRSGLRSNYELSVLASAIQDRMEASILQLTSLQLKDKGDKNGAADALLQAQVANARADQEQAASILYTDPRYAPPTKDGVPNMERYLQDGQAQAQALLKQQNTAADLYNRWSKKADTYVGVLALLAIALFLLGLAQAASPRLRLLFAIVGVLAVGAGSLWALYTLLI